MSGPIILSTGSLYNFDVGTVMALAGEIGFDGLELIVDWRRETHQPAHLESLMARHKLPILAIHSPFATALIQGWPDDPVARIKQSVQLAETLGAKTVVVHPPQRWIRLQALAISPTRTWKISVPVPVVGPGRLGRWLWHDLPEFQSQTPVKIAVENMPCRPLGPIKLEPHHFAQPETLNHFQYLTLDTTHVGTREPDLLGFYRQIKANVAHIHLSNYNGQQHQLPTQGHLPLAPFLAELVNDAFAGLISLELSPFSLHAEDEQVMKQNLRDSLAFCRQALSAATTQ
ncbi:MAG TPA: sugar phosphate isomerase/epimerase [Anaerolineae bacterium]